MPVNVSNEEVVRLQQAAAESREFLTQGASSDGTTLFKEIMTEGQYDLPNSPVAPYNQSVMLATIRAMSRLPVLLPSFSIHELPDAELNLGAMIFVPDEGLGPTPAFSNGVSWLRVYDRQEVE